MYVHPKTKQAWEAYITLMLQHGETVPSAGGTHNCRNIAGTNAPSLHAYCVALDIPPNGRKSDAFQRAVLRIKTKSGVTVFKNLVSINDRMHDQIDCSPEHLASGIDWSTVLGGSVADHSHKPMPNELPRDWADGSWEQWVERSGTLDNTRTHTFYREDLSWVYGRVIRPLEVELSSQADEIADLEARLATLQKAYSALGTRLTKLEGAPPSGGGGEIYGTIVKLVKP